ncbi:DNA-methyltransferase [Natronomonas amylolytica]|uniref:DNA-methyltransferase n=1 Tax=Natronomonas amylolytica TaxID=3108498 RepID=UPI003009C2B7
MKPPEQPDGIGDWASGIYHGDCTEILQRLPADSVHTVITSPPYWQARDYEVNGQLGREETVGEYISNLLTVIEEIHRILRGDGSLWLVLGDTYVPGGQQTADADSPGILSDVTLTEYEARRKQKLFLPERIAIAMQRRGWRVRNEITWVKPDATPESVKDRLAERTESILHVVPQRYYFYDLDSVREPYSEYTRQNLERQESDTDRGVDDPHQGIGTAENTRRDVLHPGGKNPGDVIEVPTAKSSNHPASFPTEIVRTPLQTTCPPNVCANCGNPYTRQTSEQSSTGADDGARWAQDCECDTDEREPGIVLDPFCGSGTTCQVATEHNRRFIGFELNPEYVEIAETRCGLRSKESR